MKPQQVFLKIKSSAEGLAAWTIHTKEHAYFSSSMADTLFESLPNSIVVKTFVNPRHTTLHMLTDSEDDITMLIHKIIDYPTFKEIIDKLTWHP